MTFRLKHTRLIGNNINIIQENKKIPIKPIVDPGTLEEHQEAVIKLYSHKLIINLAFNYKFHNSNKMKNILTCRSTPTHAHNDTCRSTRQCDCYYDPFPNRLGKQRQWVNEETKQMENRGNEQTKRRK